MRLTKDMYGGLSPSKLFDLRIGQMRHNDLVHNGSWYNKLGQKLGWGDLSPGDIRHIIANLEDGEVFTIVGETDSYWYLPKGMDPLEPGVNFIVKHMRYALVKDLVLLPMDKNLDPRRAESFGRVYTLPASVMLREDIKNTYFQR